jgi:hypothetical protein
LETVASVRSGKLEPGPYRVDSYPVAVEEDCVIVDLDG